MGEGRGKGAARSVPGRRLWQAATALLLAVALVQTLHDAGVTGAGFATWRPVLYAYLLWCAAIGVSRVLANRERGLRALFLLPALLFTIAMVVFPTLFGLVIAFSDWNLASLDGRHFNGLANLRAMLADAYFAGALGNMGWYVLAVLAQYAIAFGLALLLHEKDPGAKILPRGVPAAADAEPRRGELDGGKSILEYRFGPAATLARHLGWENPAFFATAWGARATIMAMDGWVSIPFVMVLLLAGLQALPGEVLESARVDGASAWQSFWKITFPLMLPVSVTAIVLRVIFELKLADIVITVTSGGPGGATDTVSSFIYREYRDRSNVGYATLLAEMYLVLIIVFVTLLLAATARAIRRVT